MIDDPQLIGLAIGIGMGLSLILTETLGVTAGGVIVPGYIALYIHEPYKVIITFLVSQLLRKSILESNFSFLISPTTTSELTDGE